jgi:hypothetical protein
MFGCHVTQQEKPPGASCQKPSYWSAPGRRETTCKVPSGVGKQNKYSHFTAPIIIAHMPMGIRKKAYNFFPLYSKANSVPFHVLKRLLKMRDNDTNRITFQCSSLESPQILKLLGYVAGGWFHRHCHEHHHFYCPTIVGKRRTKICQILHDSKIHSQ